MKNGFRAAAGAALAVVASVPMIAHAQATPPDLTELTSAIDVSTVITGVLGVGATMIGVYLAVLGYQFIKGMIKNGR